MHPKLSLFYAVQTQKFKYWLLSNHTFLRYLKIRALLMTDVAIFAPYSHLNEWRVQKDLEGDGMINQEGNG